ncbi:MAG: hypothetical protein WKF84_27890 [Pyrinomonadaceae bacterium]
MIELGGQAAEGQLRAAVQRHKKVGYVFAGSKTRMLTDMTSDPARPFYRLGSRRFIGAVPRARFHRVHYPEFYRFALQAEAGSRDADSRLSRKTCRTTCSSWHTLVGKSCAPHGGSVLTEEIVRGARARIVNQDDPFYTQIWNALTPTQRKALIAVVRERGTNLLSKQSTKLYRLPPSTMQRALEAHCCA